MNAEKTEKNPAAVALGRKGRGHPKTLTDKERERRAAQMRAIRLAQLKKRGDDLFDAGIPDPCPKCGSHSTDCCD